MSAYTLSAIEKMGRVIFPRGGIHDLATLVRTIVKNHGHDSHVKFYRGGSDDGRWSWFSSKSTTGLYPATAYVNFPGNWQRDGAGAAREDLGRALENLIDNDANLATIYEEAQRRRVSPKKTKAAKKLDEEIEAALANPRPVPAMREKLAAFKRAKEAAGGYVSNLVATDLDKHDASAIAKHLGQPFVWLLGTGGTHLVWTSPKDGKLDTLMRVVKGAAETWNEDDREIFYFDGGRGDLRRVSSFDQLRNWLALDRDAEE